MRQKTDTEYAEDLRKFIEGYKVKSLYIDPSAASFRVELSRVLPHHLNVFEANNNVLDGIRYVSTLLSNGTLKILRNCTNLISEIETYRWDDKAANRGEDKPIKENDHALDAMRYALVSEWYKKEGPGLSPEELERFRLEASGVLKHGKFFDDVMW